jgi:N-acetylmuramoyl-L-alanine amidase
MMRWLQIFLLIVAPVGVLGGMVYVDRTYGSPGRGHDYVLRIELPEPGSLVDLPPVLGPQNAARPLIVLDAGHGGHDPGSGRGALKEKTLTLALSRALRDELLNGGGVRVAMTRDEDRYLLLEERADIARRLGADLFLSIHADSIEEGDARGASVYTLSEKGTSLAAARFAERENQADTVNGIQLADTSDTVSAILVDLSQRETQSSSEELARLILREIDGRMRVHFTSVQSAAFVVLKSPDVPSVLMEAGYISHPDDAALLASREGQQTFADVTAKAIRAYFARKSGGAG